MLELADRAASSGLRDVSIEPLRADGAVPDGRRTVRIVAEGHFHALLQMVGGLARFPVLAVPSALRVERGKEAARVEMSVDVFPALPAPTSTGGEPSVLAGAPGADPFGEAGSSDAQGRLSAWPARFATVMQVSRCSTTVTARSRPWFPATPSGPRGWCASIPSP